MTRAMRLSTAELVDLKARMAGRASLVHMRDNPAERTKRNQKYGNSKVEDAGRTFDSKAEHKRWQYLAMLEKAGEIKDLRCQVVFELAPAVVIGGRKRPPLRYIADFVWEEGGETVVADVKGAVPEAYRIKRHLMKSVHGIDILEIRS